VNKILFISTERIGDSIALTPSIRAAANFFKDSEIHLICKKSNYPIFYGNKFIKKIHLVSSARLIATKFLFLKKNYEICFCYSVNISYILFAARISKKVKVFNNRNFETSKKNIEVSVLPPENSRDDIHISIEKFRLLEELGIKESSFRYDFSLTEDDISFGENLKNSFYSKFEKIICLKLTSDPKKSYRDWPIERFIQLIGLILKKNKKIGFFIIGSKLESALINKVSLKYPDNVYGYYNQSIRQSTSIISICDLYIGVDTGMTHLATCFNIPIIGLYHDLNPHSRGGPINYHKDFSLDMKNFRSKKNVPRDLGIISASEIYKEVIKIINI